MVVVFVCVCVCVCIGAGGSEAVAEARGGERPKQRAGLIPLASCVLPSGLCVCLCV